MGSRLKNRSLRSMIGPTPNILTNFRLKLSLKRGPGLSGFLLAPCPVR